MNSLLKTLELLANIVALGAEEAYGKIKSVAPVYIKSFLITTILWLLVVPGFAILKAVTGVVLFGYLFAFSALLFTLAIGLLWTPLGVFVGMLSGQTINPAKAGNRYVKFVATVFFFELVASIYIMKVPMHQNIGMVPILLASVFAVILGSAVWGGWISGRFYTFVATIVMMSSTLSFFLPKTFEAVSNKVENVDSGIAEFVSDTTSADDSIEDSSLSAPSASSESLSQQRKLIEIEVESGKWTNRKLVLPSGVHFDCDFPGQWVDWRFQNGTIVRGIENGDRFVVDENGKVIRRFPASNKLPGREFYVRSPVPGTVSFTIL